MSKFALRSYSSHLRKIKLSRNEKLMGKSFKKNLEKLQWIKKDKTQWTMDFEQHLGWKNKHSEYDAFIGEKNLTKKDTIEIIFYKINNLNQG